MSLLGPKLRTQTQECDKKLEVADCWGGTLEHGAEGGDTCNTLHFTSTLHNYNAITTGHLCHRSCQISRKIFKIYCIKGFQKTVNKNCSYSG